MATSLQALAANGSVFPGNALGSTPIPNFPNSSESTSVGAGAKLVGWSAWIKDVTNQAWKIVNPAAAIMPTAAEIAKEASQETSNFVSSTVSKVTGAVTGFGSGILEETKYIVWGILAIAVLYVLATIVVPFMAATKRAA